MLKMRMLISMSLFPETGNPLKTRELSKTGFAHICTKTSRKRKLETVSVAQIEGWPAEGQRDERSAAEGGAGRERCSRVTS